MNTLLAPDLILHNGNITTLDPKHAEARNLAIKGGSIIGVDDAETYQRGPETKVIDLKGRRVIPGLNDSHLHVIRAGLYYNLELRWDGVPRWRMPCADSRSRRSVPHRPIGCASSAAGTSGSLLRSGCRPWRN